MAASNKMPSEETLTQDASADLNNNVEPNLAGKPSVQYEDSNVREGATTATQGDDTLLRRKTTANLSKFTLRKRPWRPASTPFEEVYSHTYAGEGTLENPYVVAWLDTYDHENPQTWGKTYKWIVTAVAAIDTFVVALASSAYSGSIAEICQHFSVSQEVATLGLSLFVLGFAIGPVFWAPLSETYGRRNILLISYTFLTLWNGMCAVSPNIGALLVFRFLAGAFGSSPLTNSGGTISDIFNAQERALGVAFFALAPFAGPSAGPIIGAFLGEVKNGWRWIQILLCCLSGLLTIISFFVVPETYAPTLLRRRAKILTSVSQSGKIYRAPQDVKGLPNPLKLLKTALIRPWILLFLEPIVLLLSLYMSVVYGCLYAFFGAFPVVYEGHRGWSAGIAALPFLGVLFGMFGAVAYVIFVDNPRYIRISKANGGAAPPETRLPSSILGGVWLVIGLAMFSGTDGPDIHWIVSVIASAFFGLGMVLVFLALMNYLVDAYLVYAYDIASVLAANAILRSVFGAVFPLFTVQMYDALGIHWAPAIFAFICLGLLPAPVLFYKYGAAIRAKCKYAAEAAVIFERMFKNAPQAQEKAAPQTEEKVASQAEAGADQNKESV